MFFYFSDGTLHDTDEHTMTFNWPYTTDERLRTLLEPQISHATLSHAYVFHGIAGSGKDSLMRTFARAIQCGATGRPCGSCESCTAHKRHSHPDFVDIGFFSQGGQEITVDMVREFTRSLLHRSVLTESKIGLISGAEHLTLVAANALLKILEEPPAQVVILMSSSDLASMPATLLSRCQAIHVRRLPAQTMRLLYAGEETKGANAEECLILAGGRIALMERLLNGGLNDHHGRISAIITMLSLFPNTISQELDAVFRKQKKASVDGKISQRFVRELIQDLESVIRDMLVVHLTPRLVRNIHFKSEIQTLARQLHPTRALHLLRSLFMHQQSIVRDSGNPQLHCEYLFLGV